jgi:lysophospholipase L1-like esterase
MSVGSVTRRVAYLAIGCVSALIVTEMGARLAVNGTLAAAAPVAGAREATPNVSLNSLGYREREIPPKSPDRYRIVVIGDSYTWGQGLEAGERFSNLLESLLGPRYEVLNFGTPGHRIYDDVTELDRLQDLHPDFALLQLYVNDFEMPDMKRPAPLPLLPRDWRGSIEQSSVVYQMLDDRWAHLQETLGLVDSYEGYMARHLANPQLPDAREAFGDLRTFFMHAQSQGVQAGAVLFPAADSMGPFGANYPFGFIHDQVRATCFQARATCLDLFDLFAKLPDPQTSWVSPFDAHPNAAMNRQAAQLILTTFQGAWRR